MERLSLPRGVRTPMTISFILSSLFFFLQGCGSFIQNTAIDTTAGLMYKGTDEIIGEKNWEMFRDGTPGNLKMLEGLAYLRPENEELLVSLTKGLAGLAFVVDETLYLEEQMTESEKTPNKNQAIMHYSKAMDYGLSYLKLKGISYSDLQARVIEDNGIFNLLEKNLSSKMIDLEAVIFTAQSLGSLINLQRANMTLVAQLPIAKAMFDWVCAKSPDINFGACGIFYGAYESGRPRALGGNPKKGQKIFLETIEKYPENTLVRVSYIQYYLIPQGEIDLYQVQKVKLEEAGALFKKEMSWTPAIQLKKENAKGNHHEGGFCIYKALGLKRFEIIKKYEKKLF